MADHEIKASFKVEARAGIGNTTSPFMLLVPEVARVFRDLQGAYCADDAERRAVEILTALDIVQQHAIAEMRIRATVMSERVVDEQPADKPQE